MAGGGRTGAWIRAGSEFVVIVVGVLVALALENWASDRADQTSEIQYLEALSRDLRSDSTLMTDLLVPVVLRAQSALTTIAPVARGEVPLPADTIALLQLVIASTRSFSQLGTRTTFDELLATGSLRLVESPGLRAAVVGYYGSKTLAENRTETRLSGYADLVRGYLPDMGGRALRVTASAERGRIEGREELLRSYGIRQAIDALRTPEFVQAMNRHISLLGLVGPMLESLLAEVEELIPQVDGELDRLD